MLSLTKRFVALYLLFSVLCSYQCLYAQESLHTEVAARQVSPGVMTPATEQDTAQDIPKLYERSLWRKIGPTWIVGPGLTLVPTEYFADCMARLELTTNELDKKSLALPEKPVEFTEKRSFLVPFIVVASLGIGFAGGLIVTNCSK